MNSSIILDPAAITFFCLVEKTKSKWYKRLHHLFLDKQLGLSFYILFFQSCKKECLLQLNILFDFFSPRYKEDIKLSVQDRILIWICCEVCFRFSMCFLAFFFSYYSLKCGQTYFKINNATYILRPDFHDLSTLNYTYTNCSTWSFDHLIWNFKLLQIMPTEKLWQNHIS